MRPSEGQCGKNGNEEQRGKDRHCKGGEGGREKEGGEVKGKERKGKITKGDLKRG